MEYTVEAESGIQPVANGSTLQ